MLVLKAGGAAAQASGTKAQQREECSQAPHFTGVSLTG